MLLKLRVLVDSMTKLQHTVASLPEVKRRQINDTLDVFLGKLLQEIKSQCPETIGQFRGTVQEKLYQVMIFIFCT